MAVYSSTSFLGGSSAVPEYEWVGNQLMRNARRASYRTGESPYTRQYQQAVATRTGDGVSWTNMPTAGALTAAGLDPTGVFTVGGQTYRNIGGRSTAVDAQGRTMTTGLIEDWQSAYDEAKRANEERYQQILSGLEGMGEQESKDITSAYRAAESRGVQDIVSRGLSGTTILPSMRTGVANQEVAAQARLQERLRAEKFGFMERREDIYPDITPYLNLLTQYGNVTGATGSGGGSPYVRRRPLTTSGSTSGGTTSGGYTAPVYGSRYGYSGWPITDPFGPAPTL